MFKQNIILIIIPLCMLMQAKVKACFCGSNYTGVNNYGATLLTVPANTLAKNKFSIGYSFNFQKYNEFNINKYQELRRQKKDSYSIDSVLNQSINFAYGISDDLDFIAVFPFRLYHKLNSTVDGFRFDDGDDFGIGDLMFLAKYRFYNSMKSSAAILIGLEIPSGDSNLEANDSSIVGSGSWDPIMGLAYSRNFQKINFDSNILYLLSTSGNNNINFGDTLNLNMALSRNINELNFLKRKIIPTRILGQKLNWNLITELNGLWQEQVEFDNIKDPNQGGFVIFATTGLRMTINENFSNSFYFSLPVIQNLNGNQSEFSYQIGFNTILSF